MDEIHASYITQRRGGDVHNVSHRPLSFSMIRKIAEIRKNNLSSGSNSDSTTDMKKRLLLLASMLLAAHEAAEAQQNGGCFLKRIENNYANSVRVIEPDGSVHGMYNLDSKSELEKRFFGDFNAPVEFFVAPSFEGSSGLRLYRDSTGNWMLEAKQVTNYREVEDELTKAFPLMSFSAEQFRDSTLIDSSLRHNRAMIRRIRTEAPDRYRIEAQKVPVGEALAKQIYEYTTHLIDRYRGSEYPDMVFDGEQITFRSVVGYDLWTLTLHSPRNHEAEKATGLYRQLIADILTGQVIDEEQYIRLLTSCDSRRVVRESQPAATKNPSVQNSRRHSRQ